MLKKQYVLAIGYRTNRVAICLLRYVDTVSICGANLVKTVKLQMITYFFNSKDPKSVTSFLATFKLACDTIRIHQGAAMWFLSHFVKVTIAKALNSRMCAENRMSPLTATMRYKDARPRKLLRSYPNAVK